MHKATNIASGIIDITCCQIIFLTINFELNNRVHSSIERTEKVGLVLLSDRVFVNLCNFILLLKLLSLNNNMTFLTEIPVS